jgi:hypothetical protein
MIQLAEKWGKQAKQDDLKDKIEFLNQNCEKFDWDTDEEPDKDSSSLVSAYTYQPKSLVCPSRLNCPAIQIIDLA